MKIYIDPSRAATLHAKGFSDEEIAVELGVSKITVQRWRKWTNEKPNKCVAPVMRYYDTRKNGQNDVREEQSKDSSAQARVYRSKFL
jgi:transposase